MEKLNLRSSRSQIKIIGTLVSVAGALVLTLYKGPSIGSFARNSLSPPSESSHRPLNSSSYLLEVSDNWVIAGFFSALLKGYPSQLTTAAVYCLFGSIQSAGVSLIAERNNPNPWKPRPDIEVNTIVCSVGCIRKHYDILCANSVNTNLVCIPVFVAMFKPLGMAIAAMMSVIILGDTLHVGTQDISQPCSAVYQVKPLTPVHNTASRPT